MDYFKILNLNKEPFSNSPDPDFFFPSSQHVQCLQKLELSIRLRKGLNVITGEVGTGKTTLCRELIRKFSTDKDKLETHLILDPGFTSPKEFLQSIAFIFGDTDKTTEQTEWQIKEELKRYLFKRGVDEEKIVTLIIDEGQKLPVFCLEILRELLNYETNKFKLLQVVIFAQREFDETLSQQENFTDRINLYHQLGPLNFKETREMISFRLSKATNGAQSLNIFSYIGLFCVYRYSKGYPRKIVNLCSKIILSLIVQNRSRAGWFLVRLSAKRTFSKKGFQLKWVALSAIVIALAFDFVFVSLHTSKEKTDQSTISQQLILPKPGTASALTSNSSTPIPQTDTLELKTNTSSKIVEQAETKIVNLKVAERFEPEPESKKESAPLVISERIIIEPGDTISGITKILYGSFLPNVISVINRNSHISNINSIEAGDEFFFPFRQDTANAIDESEVQVTLCKKNSLEETYRFIKKQPKITPEIFLIPYKNQKEGLVFAIFLGKGFKDKETARTAIRKLPGQLAKSAYISDNWEDDTIFYKAP